MRLEFPSDFLWGTATAAHQVEGNNRNSDWWAWEHRPGSPVAEPSGSAIEQYGRYESDIRLLADLGIPVYRFSVEWARVEPTAGDFDAEAVRHYRAVAEACRNVGLVPMVTLNHFTLPVWVAAQGGWLNADTPALLARYCAHVVTALDDLVDWYCTINEPGMVAFGGYVGALGFPPGSLSLPEWDTAIDRLCEGLVRSRETVKTARPEAAVGSTHAMVEYEANEGGRPLMEFFRGQMEDRFFAVCGDDDFIGVQTYTRQAVNVPRIVAPLARSLVQFDPLRRAVLPRLIRRLSRHVGGGSDEPGVTDMGYEYRPEAVAATVRRAHEVFPGKDIIVTEHGIATTNDEERVSFIREGLASLHQTIVDGIPLKGYVHWSAFDNFEWALGYGMQFGLISVNRSTQERTPKPSAHYFGTIAQENAVEL